MGDIIDRAQRYEEFHRHQSLQAALRSRSAAPETPLDIDGVRFCLDCEEPLPPGRVAANPHAVRCVPCQTKEERRR